MWNSFIIVCRAAVTNIEAKSCAVRTPPDCCDARRAMLLVVEGAKESHVGSSDGDHLPKCTIYV